MSEAETAVQLTADEVREIGDALFYAPWQTALGEAIGASRQTVAHYLRHGVTGTQAAALVGLIARRIFEGDTDHAAELDRLSAEHAVAKAEKTALYARFASRLGLR